MLVVPPTTCYQTIIIDGIYRSHSFLLPIHGINHYSRFRFIKICNSVPRKCLLAIKNIDNELSKIIVPSKNTDNKRASPLIGVADCLPALAGLSYRAKSASGSEGNGRDEGGSCRRLPRTEEEAT